jgi:hypothetical protein
MRNCLKTAWVGLALTLALVACSEKEGPQQPEKPLTPSEKFTARYIIPLTTGRQNGEHEIVDPRHAAQTNIAQLKPTILEVVKAAMAGKISSYPDDDKQDIQSPMTALPKAIAQWEQNGGPKVTENELAVSLEVGFDGVVAQGYTKLAFSYMDLIWVDPTEQYPDRRMARIHKKDLTPFHVQKNGTSMSLSTYIQEREFQSYVIGVAQGDEYKGVKTFAASDDMQQLIEQGQIAEILRQ